MNNNESKFLKKLSELPEEVDYFFSSKFIVKLVNEISERYKIENNLIIKLIIDIVAEDFKFHLIEEKIKKDLNIKKEDETKFIIDFLGKLFLPIDDFLESDVKSQITTRGGSFSDYTKYIFELRHLFEDERWKVIDELIKKHKELVIPEEEEAKIFNILESNLIDLLKIESSEALSYLNGSLIYLLFNKKDFKNNLVKYLQKCEDRISEKEFVIGDEKRYSTISNWLKDFVKKNGSGIPSNVAISEYIIKSENAKKLSEEEKANLYRLLLFYKNIRFFPKVLEGVEPDKWEIFPVLENQSYSKGKKNLTAPKTIAEKNIEKMVEEAKSYKDNSLEKLAIEEEIEHEKKMEELRFMATKFAEGSLERKAIEEELRKMQHKA